MTQHLDKKHTFKGLSIRTDSPSMSYRHVLKGLRLAGIVFVTLIAALFTSRFVSAKPAATDTYTFCTDVTSYGGMPHCQTGDKDTNGWYDKKVPKHVPPIASMKILNLGGNPGSGGMLTIYTPQLYCASYWSDFVGHGYIEVNGQRFATCRTDVNDLGPGGYNHGASYLFVKAQMVRIVTNIRLHYGDIITIRIFGRIYATIRDNCRKEEMGRCVYPGISPGWVYAYTKTGARVDRLANFYKGHNTINGHNIYDFLTIEYADLDSDNHYSDYYDFDDLSMTLALSTN